MAGWLYTWDLLWLRNLNCPIGQWYPTVLMRHPLSLTKAVYQLDFEQGPVSPTGTSLFLCHSTLTPQQFTIIGEVHDVIPLDLGVWGWCCTCVGCLLTVAIDHVSGVARTSVWRLVWPHNLCQSPHYFKGDSILWWDSWPLSQSGNVLSPVFLLFWSSAVSL